MSTKDLYNLIKEDIKNNSTPDLAEMRYYGDTIPVFLWDDLQDYANISMALHPLSVSDNYQVRFFSAHTMSEHVPWYNLKASEKAFTSYCLEEYDDVCFLDIPDYSKGTPRQVQGKIVKVSLAALQKLDEYYCNTYIFTRQVVSVKPSKLAQPCKAYTWFNQVDQISTYSNEDCEYILDEGLDFTPFKENIEQDTKFYKVS